ncbi:MAG: hypothetical protein ABSD59_08505 [Terracidiphilus sp.]|jgi:hypothetical protein
MAGKAGKGASLFDWLKFISGYLIFPVLLVVYLLEIDWHELGLTLFSRDEGVRVHPIAQILLAPAQMVARQPVGLTLHLLVRHIISECLGITLLIGWCLFYMAITVLPIWLLLKVTFGLKYQKAKLVLRIFPQNKWANKVIALANQKPVPPAWLDKLRRMPQA